MATSAEQDSEGLRLQVFLSHSGLCSRRKAMELIVQGKVSVNGKQTCEPSTRVHPGKDNVQVNGRPVGVKPFEYLMLHKPKGYVTTRSDKFAEKTVMDLLPVKYRHLYPVGRLDKDTEGLLLMTNDGNLTNRLTHPRFDVEKVYAVQIDGCLSPDEKSKIQKGIMLDGKRTLPARISQYKQAGRSSEFLISLHEGRKRQIRLMIKHLGYRVVDLKRIQHGSLKLGSLKIGSFRHLTEKEIASL